MPQLIVTRPAIAELDDQSSGDPFEGAIAFSGVRKALGSGPLPDKVPPQMKAAAVKLLTDRLGGDPEDHAEMAEFMAATESASLRYAGEKERAAAATLPKRAVAGA
jgi:hypothetical protein